MLVPNDQACENQTSSTTPIPAAQTAAAQSQASAIQAAVANAQTAASALLVSNPWEDWRGGFNLMKDVQRSNMQVVGAGPAAAMVSGSGLPGIPPAGGAAIGTQQFPMPDGSVAVAPLSRGGSPMWGRLTIYPRGSAGAASARSGNARSAAAVKGWDSRFVTGPGGRFATWPGSGGRNGLAPGGGVRMSGRPGRLDSGRGKGSGGNWGDLGGDARPGNCGELRPCSPTVVECHVEAADVVASDGYLTDGAAPAISQPPANPPLRTEQSGNIIVAPPAQYGGAGLGAVARRRGGMGEWSQSIAEPGAVPSACATGAAATPGAAGVPWWLWLLAGVVIVAAANANGDDKGGKKRAA